MLDAANKLADHYVAVACMLGLQRPRASQAKPVNSNQVKNAAIHNIACRVLNRLGLFTELTNGKNYQSLACQDISQPNRSQTESINDLDEVILPIESIQIFDLDSRFFDNRVPLPVWLIDLLALSNSGWNKVPDRYQDILDSALLAPVLLILNQRECSDLHPSTWQRFLSNGCPRPDALHEQLSLFLSRLNLADFSNVTPCWTNKGRFLIDRALLGGVAIFYAPLLKTTIKVLQGDSCSADVWHSQGSLTANQQEQHVDRHLNVISSGFQHHRFFDDMMKTLLAEYQGRPGDQLPKLIADMGCGDASLFRQIKDSIGHLYPSDRLPILIAADLNEAALRAASQKLAGIHHLLMEADILDPQRFAESIDEKIDSSDELRIKCGIQADSANSEGKSRTTPLESDPTNLLRDQVLHVRTFLDHDRSFNTPADVIAAQRWLGLSLQGQYLQKNGDALPAHLAFQSLVEHLDRWSQIVGRHGLLMLEVHSMRNDSSHSEAHQTNTIHFEAIHSLSGQQLVEADNFLLAAAAAGLFSDTRSIRRYPEYSQRTQIGLHWFRTRPVKLRLAELADLPELSRLEHLCWNDMSVSDDELSKRIAAKPSGVFVLNDRDTGQIVASLATQRIASEKSLFQITAEQASLIANQDGRILQLLSLNVLPELQEHGYGELLLDFILSYVQLSDQLDWVVGITRCRDAVATNEEEFKAYVHQRDSAGKPVDPILIFHHDHGATLGQLIPNYRPADLSNCGYGVIIRYQFGPPEDDAISEINDSKTGSEPDRFESASAHEDTLSAATESNNVLLKQDKRIDIHTEVRRLLKGRGINEYDPEKPLLELGLDSLGIQSLRAAVAKRTGKELTADFFFNHPTPAKMQAALAGHLSDRRFFKNSDRLPEASLASDEPHTEAPHSSTSTGKTNQGRTSASTSSNGRTETQLSSKRVNSDGPTNDSPFTELAQGTVAHHYRNLPQTEPIAIIGMACRFPGQVENLNDYWNLLCAGRSSITEVPVERWDSEQLYDADPDAPGKMWTRKGGFLNGIDQFDAAFFGISRREARKLDPQQRMLLETTWQAFEDAGLAPIDIAGSKTGMFAGVGCNDYFSYVMPDFQTIDAYCASGTFQSTASGRLAYFYDLRGPCLSIDTACSSSVSALHLAVQSLRQRESQMAMVAGVNFISPEVSINFTKARMLSPDGLCRTFDKSANGYVRGEGCGAVILKRLSDAQRDGDCIQAVIRATGCNQDGRSNGLTAPNGLAQRDLLIEMLEGAQVPPESIAYAEAHGTATPLGDPIEANALIDGLRRQAKDPSIPLLISSVKTNLGHLEAAAGMASLIKVVLALQNKKIPPHLNFSQWNPEINRSGVDVDVPLKTVDFPLLENSRRATISSFGFGGTNAMAVIEENVDPSESNNPCNTDSGPQIICLSAKTQGSLRRAIQSWLDYLPNSSASLHDLALGSQLCRQHFPIRKAVIAASTEEAMEALMEIQVENNGHYDSKENRLAMLFTGQGSQYPNMGRALYDSQPVFRETMDACFDCFSGRLPHSLRDVIFCQDRTDSRIHETLYTQPALLALEIALARMWQHFGVEPSLCFGHSIGEFTAAVVVGALRFEDAVSIVAERARLIDSLPRTGGMSACFTDDLTIAPLLEAFEGRLSIAAANSPGNTVISGELKALEQAEGELRQRGIACQRLTVSHAFHSALIQPIAKQFGDFCAQFEFSMPQIPLISNVTGQPFDELDRYDADYLVRHMLGTVRFADSVRTASELGATIFLELGPDATLTGLGKRTIPDGKKYLATHSQTWSGAAETETDASWTVRKWGFDSLERGQSWST